MGVTRPTSFCQTLAMTSSVTSSVTSAPPTSPTGARLRTMAELEEFYPVVEAAPKDVGTVRLVVARPAVNERVVLDVGVLDLDEGLIGDSWKDRPSSRMKEDVPHPRMQLNVMSWPMAEFLAFGDEERVPHAGDQLYLDLDLSHDNLPAGTRLLFGEASAPSSVIEVTEEPHTGCKKFIARFGVDAMRFVNGRAGRPLRLRGLNAVVIQPGEVRPGDTVTVQRPS